MVVSPRLGQRSEPQWQDCTVQALVGGSLCLRSGFLEGRLLRSTWDECEAVRHFDVLSAIVRRVAVDPSFCHRTAGFDRDATSNLFGRRRGLRGRRTMICVLLFRPRLTPRIGMRSIRFPELPGRRGLFVSRGPLLSSTAM